MKRKKWRKREFERECVCVCVCLREVELACVLRGIESEKGRKSESESG